MILWRISNYSALDGAGMTWPSEIVGDLAATLEEYRQRSARYRPFVVASLLEATGPAGPMTALV